MHQRIAAVLMCNSVALHAIQLIYVCTCRKVQVVQFIDGDIVELQSVFVALKTGEFTVEAVALKVAEALNTNQTFVILDSGLKEIISCESTNGKGYFSVIICLMKQSMWPRFNSTILAAM